MYEVIPARRWVNRRAGGIASLYGAHPCPGSPDWHLEDWGWTVRNLRTNTVGIGRAPWQTRQEAEDWVRLENLRSSTC